MAIERILKVKEPALFDKVVTSIQDTLGESLPWLDHVFGVAERLIKETNGVRRYTPNIYIGNNEYLCMLPDETLGNFSFFVLDDPAEVAWARGERNRLTVPFSLVVWLDMRTVGDGKTRNRERVKDDILKVMNGGLRLRNGHAVVTAYALCVLAEVFAGHFKDIVSAQHNASVYHVAADNKEGIPGRISLRMHQSSLMVL
jgi:hypothetical protein